jgi:CubicO group peptidase (beta-lactamase class C family)
MGRKLVIGATALVAALGVGAYEKRDFLYFAMHAPKNRDVLQWTVPQRDYAFRHLADLPMIKAHPMSPSATPIAFTQGPALPIAGADGKPFDMDAFMADQRGVGTLIVVDGKIRLEKYGLGYTDHDTWTSFSVAKSFTSTLIGAAIKDGYIKSVDEPVTDIIPEFKGTAYEGVTIKHILTMSSGVQWNEDYADPNSDVGKMSSFKSKEGGEEAVVAQLKRQPRAAPPGTRWHYSTAETGLIGVIVMRATHKPMAQYLNEKIWSHKMAQPGFWVLDLSGREMGGCCISSALSDYARMGQFIMDGAKVDGASILPDGWIQAATHKQKDIDKPGRGYGYQWWTYDDGSFAAVGHFGQTIFVDPKRKLVIATNADFPSNNEHDVMERRFAYHRLVQQAVDREQGVAGRALMQ